MSLLKTTLLVVVTAIAITVIPRYMKKPLPPIWSGYTAPGWEEVGHVYKEMIESGEEMGSAFTVYHKGQLVVNLVGGYADESSLRPWRKDTVSLAYSSTKGVGAIVAAMMVERGLLDYKEKVTTYWPEFAENGKQDVTVEMLLSHQAGLAILDEDFTLSELRENPEKISRILAKQKPLWEPGTNHGYHTITFGMYVNELVKRVDPKHRPIWQIIDEDIAQPFDLDFVVGLSFEKYYRTTHVVSESFFRDWESFTALHSWKEAISYMLNEKALQRLLRSYENPADFKGLTGEHNPEFASAPMVSSHGFGTAEALAKLYGIITSGGSWNNRKLLSPSIAKLLVEPLVSGPDQVLLNLNTTYGRGTAPLLTPAGSTMFGTPGHGGQVAYGDMEHELGFAYLTNYLSKYFLANCPRFLKLQKAMYDVVLEKEKHKQQK